METMSLLKDTITESVSQMSFAFYPSEGKHLLPVTNHRRGQLFDPAAIKQYLSTTQALTTETTADSKEVSGKSFKSVASALESKISAGGSYGSSGACVSMSVKAEFGVSSEETEASAFAQIRKELVVATVNLPGHHQTEMAQLMLPSVLSQLSSVSSSDMAKQILSNYGPFFMAAARFGAVLTLSTNSSDTSSDSASRLMASLHAEAEYLGAKGSVDAELLKTKTEKLSSSSETYELYAVGGDPAMAVNKDTAAWADTARKNPAIILYDLRPISDLINPQANAMAYGLVKAAVDEYISEHQKILAELDANLGRENSADFELKPDPVWLFITSGSRDSSANFMSGVENVLLHINPRPSQNCVVFNSFISSWGSEVRGPLPSSGRPIRFWVKSSPSELVITYNDDSDQAKRTVIPSGGTIIHFPHRAPFVMPSILAPVTWTAVDKLGPFVLSTEWLVHTSPTRDGAVNFMSPDLFQVLLHISLRPYDHAVVLNTYNGGWGNEERISFPKGAGRLKISVQMSSMGFLIDFPGQTDKTGLPELPYTYKHRLSPNLSGICSSIGISVK